MIKRFTVLVLLILALFAPCCLRAAVVPAGTLLIVRTLDPISSSSSPGTRFAGRLDANLVLKGKVVAPAGTRVYGRVNSSQAAERAFGRSTLSAQKRLAEAAPALCSEVRLIGAGGPKEELRLVPGLHCFNPVNRY
jgi:hypothetical protein